MQHMFGSGLSGFRDLDALDEMPRIQEVKQGANPGDHQNVWGPYDGDDVLIIFDNGYQLRGVAQGDCCSTSWVEHLTVPSDIAGAVITGYKQTDAVEGVTPEEEAHQIKESYGDVLQVYGEAVVTDRGEIVIEYRNSSNGYYGGWMEWKYEKVP